MRNGCSVLREGLGYGGDEDRKEGNTRALEGVKIFTMDRRGVGKGRSSQISYLL